MSPKQTPLISKITLSLINIFFYGVGIVTLYLLFTANWYGLLFLIFLIVIQMPISGRKQAYINLIVKYMKPHEFFNMSRIYEEKIDEKEKVLFCVHPHSVFGYGLIMNLNNPLEPESKLSKSIGLGSQFALNLPLFGLHFKAWGIESADSKNFKKLMSEGKDLLLLPGGYEEATLTTPNELRIYIKNRKGFIKYALEYGYTIRHVMVTGEHRAMWTFDHFLNWRLIFNKLKIPGVIYWGRWGLFFPPGVEMITIIGKGLRRDEKKRGEIGEEEVEEMHSKYIEELKELYEKHKHLNGNVAVKVF